MRTRILLVSALLHMLATAANANSVDTFSFGASSPLLVSGSVGKRYYFQPDAKNLTSSFAVDTDATVGVGGGIVSIGTLLPLSSAFSINLKLSRMRTWLWSMGEPINEDFNGVIIDLIAFGHTPVKIGMGAFTNIGTHKQSGPDLYYFFGGIGF